MAKKLYINTKSIPLDNTHVINNAANINYNQILVQLERMVPNIYSYIMVSDTGLVTINSNINYFDKTTSFIFSSGGQPRIVGTKKTSSYYESKPSIDLKVNNIIQ